MIHFYAPREKPTPCTSSSAFWKMVELLEALGCDLYYSAPLEIGFKHKSETGFHTITASGDDAEWQRFQFLAMQYMLAREKVVPSSTETRIACALEILGLSPARARRIALRHRSADFWGRDAP